jgi:protein-tyrosine kinase
MERIKQAVEQARRERANSGIADLVRPRAVAADPPLAKPETSGGAAEAASFEYSQTRCIEVSEQVRERNRLVAGIDGNPLQDIYRMLRTRVLQEMTTNGWNTIAITSPGSGSGKTLTAINLAIMLARDLSHTALLIDGDLRRPSVSKYFEHEPEFGLNDYLFNDVPLSKIFIHPDMGRLTLLPGREPISESAELLGSKKIIDMLADIRSRYTDRIVVVDIAPVLSVDDALALAPHVDCMLMVAEAGETKREDLGRALELLDNIPIVGTVLNKVKKKVDVPY